uniref:Tyrosine-protein kinase n=1 Tax=Echinococcus granulosus TaxID=6210 RepID=A0A068WYY1_ECHGR|nr:tyrosine protein kinase Fyn [Echinococcus granulosus]
MGNCGTHSSAVDEVEEANQYPELSLEQLDHLSLDLQNNLVKYGTKYLGPCKPSLHGAATDPSFDQISNADMPCDAPSARSTTPSSGIRPKSYVKCPSLDESRAHGSSSPISYGGGGSISSERRHQLEQRPNSASHLLRYGLNHVNNNSSNHSPSANSCCPPNEQRNPRPSPTVKQMQHCVSSNTEKYSQKLTPKPVHQKYLVHHSLGKNSSKYFVAIFDYKARCEGDLTVHKGDAVVMLDRSDTDWWLVENATTHQHGYVPSAYLAEENSIEVFEWYFREISRKDSERLLVQQGNPTGTFLVRPSETTRGGLSLSVRDYDPSVGAVVCHFKIKHHPPSGGICITSTLVFPNLVDLINHYTSHADGLCCRLTQPYPRPPPFLSDLSRRTKDDWEIPRSSLVLQERLGAGQFGEVWRGEWKGTTPVAIKTLKEGTMTKEDFLKEARIMKTLSHPHLVRLFAVVTTEPIYIVTELMPNGSLLAFLRSDVDKTLGLKELVDFMSQIATGMAYLEEKCLVHRDLAARNVLVGDNNIVKIADFGLTRAIDTTTEAYTAKQGAKFPIKWTAPEAAYRGQFTIKSDVWSFGVVMYEIITHGQEPFPSMSTMETLDQVNNGYRMPCPQNCPAAIYEVMLHTWDATPDLRPTFVLLCEFFETFVVADPHPIEPEAATIDSRTGALASEPCKRRPGHDQLSCLPPITRGLSGILAGSLSPALCWRDLLIIMVLK